MNDKVYTENYMKQLLTVNHLTMSNYQKKGKPGANRALANTNFDCVHDQ